jgi:hypothetical protein
LNASTLNILNKLIAKKDDIELFASEQEIDLLEIY